MQDMSRREDESYPGYTYLQSGLAGFHGGDYGQSLREIILSYPRVLYETAFLTGQRAYFDKAIELDPSIGPTDPVPLHYWHVENMEGGMSHAYKRLGMGGDFLVWKKWRDLTLRNNDFTGSNFPVYSDAELTGNVLLLNREIEVGQNVSNGSDTTVTVKSRHALGNDSPYRFKYNL